MRGLEENVAQQRALYGEALADTAARVMTALGFTQARLADVLQISAPMMSQLISAQRVKIGNPAVVHRLQALSELAGQASRMSADALADRLAAIRDEQATMTGQAVTGHQTRSRVGVQRAALTELRAVASAEELHALAAATSNDGLAALLRSAADAD